MMAMLLLLVAVASGVALAVTTARFRRADAATRARIVGLEETVGELSSRLADAEQSSEDAIARLQDLQAEADRNRRDFAALWALELARSTRLWHISVAPSPHYPGPFETADDPLRAAVEVEASAIGEEVGTRISVDWDLTAELMPGPALLVLRLTEELLNGVAKQAETAQLRVSADKGDVVLDLTAHDAVGRLVVPDLPWLPDGTVHRTAYGARVAVG